MFGQDADKIRMLVLIPRELLHLLVGGRTYTEFGALPPLVFHKIINVRGDRIHHGSAAQLLGSFQATETLAADTLKQWDAWEPP
jgi:hypothetical protein